MKTTRKEFLKGALAFMVGGAASAPALAGKLFKETTSTQRTNPAQVNGLTTDDWDYKWVPPVVFKREGETVSSTLWEDKDFFFIMRDLADVVATAHQRSKGLFDPIHEKFGILVAAGCAQHLAKNNEYGRSVRTFIANAWPKSYIVEVPEFDNAKDGTTNTGLIFVPPSENRPCIAVRFCGI